jgi:hypothetical protein
MRTTNKQYVIYNQHKGILFSLQKEILTQAKTWMTPEDVLCEITQTQRDKYCMIPLT